LRKLHPGMTDSPPRNGKKKKGKYGGYPYIPVFKNEKKKKRGKRAPDRSKKERMLGGEGKRYAVSVKKGRVEEKSFASKKCTTLGTKKGKEKKRPGATFRRRFGKKTTPLHGEKRKRTASHLIRLGEKKPGGRKWENNAAEEEIWPMELGKKKRRRLP